jgi:hypothetical protein
LWHKILGARPVFGSSRRKMQQVDFRDQGQHQEVQQGELRARLKPSA